MLRGRGSCAISERPTASPFVSSSLSRPLTPLFPIDASHSPVTPLFPLDTQNRGVPSLCGNYVELAKYHEFDDAFAFAARSWANQFWICSRRTILSWSESPHPRQVQCSGGKGKLRSYFRKPAHPESAHPSLFFQNSYHWFSYCFSPSVLCLPGRGT